MDALPQIPFAFVRSLNRGEPQEVLQGNPGFKARKACAKTEVAATTECNILLRPRLQAYIVRSHEGNRVPVRRSEQQQYAFAGLDHLPADQPGLLADTQGALYVAFKPKNLRYDHGSERGILSSKPVEFWLVQQGMNKKAYQAHSRLRP